MSPALAGRFSTTAPPGKPPSFSLREFKIWGEGQSGCGIHVCIERERERERQRDRDEERQKAYERERELPKLDFSPSRSELHNLFCPYKLAGAHRSGGVRMPV